jgi:predicted RND superfamily exporter protein
LERPPVATDLPPTIAEPFVERDGSLGKLAFVEPAHDEVAENLFAFADAIRSIPLPSGKVIHSSGENVVFTDVLRAVAADARKLTAASAILVLLVLLAVTRHRGAFVRVALALLVGVAWMLGLASVLHQKLNFFNFVALPTTFGIGIDYAINVEERVRQRGRAALASALGEVGPPVALASATTILGYVSLLTADNQALASFGRLAILGELACLVAALVLVPALWAIDRRTVEKSAKASVG